MYFLENTTSVFTAATVPAGVSVSWAANAALLQEFTFPGCSWLIKWNLRLFPRVMELLGLHEQRAWPSVLQGRICLLTFFFSQSFCTLPQAPCDGGNVRGAVPQNEVGLQLKRALLKYFGEVVGAVMDQMSKGTRASCVRLVLNTSPCRI